MHSAEIVNFVLLDFQLKKCVLRNAIPVEVAISCLKSNFFQGRRIMEMSWVVCLNNDCAVRAILFLPNKHISYRHCRFVLVRK